MNPNPPQGKARPWFLKTQMASLARRTPIWPLMFALYYAIALSWPIRSMSVAKFKALSTK